MDRPSGVDPLLCHVQMYRISSFRISNSVGSASAWNRSIDHAYFEFRMPKSLYDSDDGANSKWDISERKGKCYFKQEYRNWTPEEDFIELSWETDRPFYLIPLKEPRCCLIPVIASALIILISLAIIMILRRSRKRK